MKAVLALALLMIGCTCYPKPSVGEIPIDSFIVGSWRQKAPPPDIQSWTEFRIDGEVIVFYVGGSDLKGTWKKSPDKAEVEIAIRDWKLVAYRKGEELIIKNGDIEKAYVRHQREPSKAQL